MAKQEKHKLVPDHSILKDKEKEELLNKFHISLKELPKIFINDPAIADMSPKSGDVIKIVRKSQSAGTSTYYRVVING